MKEIETVLKAFAEGLKSMAQGINTLAGKVDQLAEEQFGEKTAGQEKQTNSKSGTARRGPGGRVKKAASAKTLNATEVVLEALRQSAEPLSNAALAEKTGYDRKKVSRILSRLKQRGMIKSVGTGVHAAV